MLNISIFLISFIFSLLIGKPLINYFQHLGASQSFRVEGPQNHITSKSNTPTIGGLIFLIPIFLIMSVLSIYNKAIFSNDLMIVLLATAIMGLIGFIDDYFKVKSKNNKGLSGNIKLLIQLICSILFFLIYKEGQSLVLILWIFFIFAGSCNSYNLTDGLDGLLTTISLCSFLGFGIIALYVNRIDLLVFSIVCSGALLGFLFFNKHPAKIFMGDTGSIAIGGAIGSLAIALNKELFLAFFAFIPILETLSVIIQVIYFKLTKKFHGEGKRIFKMTPLHHHFELVGWHETKIVKTFFTIQLICTIIGILAFVAYG